MFPSSSLQQPLLAKGINIIARLFYYTPISVDTSTRTLTLLNNYDRKNIKDSTDTFLTDILCLPYYLRGYRRHNQRDDWRWNSITGHIERIA